MRQDDQDIINMAVRIALAMRADKARANQAGEGRSDGFRGNWFPFFPACRDYWADKALITEAERPLFKAVFDRLDYCDAGIYLDYNTDDEVYFRLW
jgi:hypothetical protein